MSPNWLQWRCNTRIVNQEYSLRRPSSHNDVRGIKTSVPPIDQERAAVKVIVKDSERLELLEFGIYIQVNKTIPVP